LRRRILTISLIILFLALFWRDLLFFGVQMAARIHFGSQIAYRDIHWRGGEIVLTDVMVLKSSKKPVSYHMRVEKVRLAIHFLQKPVLVEIALERPSVAFLDPIQWPHDRRLAHPSKWITTKWRAENGSFEWRALGGAPFFGQFSFENEKLSIDTGSGTAAIQLIRTDQERKISCTFDQMDIAPFSQQFCARLSGNVLIELERLQPKKAIGHLRFENCSFVSSQWAGRGGAALIEWDGEFSFVHPKHDRFLDAVWSFSDPMKISCHEGYVTLNDSRLDHLDGVFSSNQGAGLRWEIQGPGFSWDGKSFSNSCQSNWLESRISMNDAVGMVRAEQMDPERSHWSLNLEKADRTLVQLVQNIWPKEWSWRFESGIVSAQLIWEESGEGIENWKLERFKADGMAIKADQWDFHCANAEAAVSSGPHWAIREAQISLVDGCAHVGSTGLSSFNFNCLIQDEKINEAFFSGDFNGLAIQGDAHGTFAQTMASIHAKGPWSQYWFWRPSEGPASILESFWTLEGNWKSFSAGVRAHFSDAESIEAQAKICHIDSQWSISEAALKARQLDLSHLRQLTGMDCSGLADLILDYRDEEMKVESAVSQFSMKTKGGTIAIEQLGRMEPFEAGVKAVWGKRNDQWTVQTARTRSECCFHGQKIRFDGQMELTGDLLKIYIAKGIFRDLEFSGDWFCSLEKGAPFSFVAQKIEGSIQSVIPSANGRIVCESDDFSLSGDFLSDPSQWEWRAKARLSEIGWGLLHDGTATMMADSKEGLIECLGLHGTVAIGQARFPIRVSELRKRGEEWLFDGSIEHPIWDLGRLAGTALIQNHSLILNIDSQKSHLLNAPIEEPLLQKEGILSPLKDAVRQSRIPQNKIACLDPPLKGRDCGKQCVQMGECQWALDGAIDLTWRISWDQILAASSQIEKIDPVLHSILESPIQGALALTIHRTASQPLEIRLEGDNIRWKGSAIPFSIGVSEWTGGWKIDHLQISALQLSCLMLRDEARWKIQNGSVQWQGSLDATISGYLSGFSKCDLCVDSLTIDLQKTIAPFIWPALDGKMEGKGYLSLEWKGELEAEADLDLNAINMKSGSLIIDNAGPMQVHFSRSQGLLIQGLDLQVHKPEVEWPWIHARIGLMQFDFSQNHWVLHHAQLNLPADSFALLQKKIQENRLLGHLLQVLDNRQDLEFFADIDCAADFSSLTCSMREGFVPFLGAVRHVQNVNLSWSPDGLLATLTAIQGGHNLKVGARVAFEPHARGRIVLEDDSQPLTQLERPLAIDWEVDAKEGLTIHSIEGAFNGSEFSFHAESQNNLIGSARLHFGPLSEILPPRLGHILQQLKMGKGYELKGRLYYSAQNLADVSFKGLLSGKQCELFGFQIRTMLSQVDLDAAHVHLFEVKISDSAGILKIDDLMMSRTINGEWNISMPLFKLLEFRPSLLQKVGSESGHVGPLVIRELKLQNLRGSLDHHETLTAKGEMNFVNSFKREHTVFDLPSDFFGRIFGLDMELLIPVRGHLLLELKEGRFWLSDLQDAYSEGKRSKFFLVKEGLSPSIGLDGNLHIFVTMKQYVLFKITENFLLTIDGSIERPSYHLQKKSKILGLSID